MSFYDPFGRPLRPGMRRPKVTIDDYHRLVATHEALQERAEELARQLRASEEALRQQTQKAMELDEALQEARRELQRLQAAQQAPEQATPGTDGDWQDRYLRLQAETDNYRRRLEQRTAQQVDEERDNVLRDMLSLADHLEMALRHWDQLQTPETQKDFRASLEATLNAFLDTLQRYGVRPMHPVGEPFDPNLHEAVGHVPSDTIPPDHVVQVVRTGYTVNGRLLRPARVLVSSGRQE